MTEDFTVQPSTQRTTAAAEFATFMSNHQNMVYTTAVRLVGSDAQAQDISQEVFLKAYERFDQLRGHPAAGGWLRTVATNLSINFIQRYKRRWRFFSESARKDAAGAMRETEFAAPEASNPGSAGADRSEWIERALAGLPDHQRVPLVLFHFENLSYDQIAARLGASLSKIKSDIHRGREALAEILMEGEDAHASLAPVAPR
jgi:RNA polymerase sigma-70 factor (ECF subfamily)